MKKVVVKKLAEAAAEEKAYEKFKNKLQLQLVSVRICGLSVGLLY